MLVLNPLANIGMNALVGISQWSKFGGSGAEFCGSERATLLTPKSP
jgi:hypothetical protein